MAVVQVDSIDVGEKVTLSFPFASELPAGVTIVSVAPIDVVAKKSLDATPALLLSGAATIVGSTVYQTVVGRVDNEDYRVKAVATWSNGDIRVRALVLPVRSI